MVFLLRVVIALKIDAFYLRTIIISVAVGHCKSHAGDGWITDQEAAKVFLPSLSLHLVVPPRAQWPKCAVVKKKKKTFQGDSPERMFLRWRIGGPNTTDNSFIYMQLNHWGGAIAGMAAKRRAEYPQPRMRCKELSVWSPAIGIWLWTLWTC